MSLADTITLPVDLANTGTTTDKSFTNISRNGNVSVYKDIDTATARKRANLQFYRTEGKRNGNFMGSNKTAFKFTFDQEVPGVDASASITAPLIVHVSMSVPIGTSDEALLAARQHMLALADNDALMDPLNKHLVI